MTVSPAPMNTTGRLSLRITCWSADANSRASPSARCCISSRGDQQPDARHRRLLCEVGEYVTQARASSVRRRGPRQSESECL